MSIDKVKRWIRPSVLTTTAYSVQDATGMIKLDAMENPYQWPDNIKKAWLNHLAKAEINRYPSADAAILKEKLKQVFSIPEANELLLGNGSDEIIQIIAMAITDRNPVFLSPEPGFVMYEVIAEFARVKFIGIPLQQDFSLDLEAMLHAIQEHEPAVVFLAYPNNPTANLFDEEAVTEIINQAPGIVVIDEAYHVFAENSFLSKLGEYDNLLIMRTLSKLGLAGLRLGFLAGPENWIREFDKLRLPYNINVLTQLSIEFILEHIDMLNEQAAKIRQDREVLYQDLSSMPGIQVWPSSTNFLLFRIEKEDSNQVFEKLKDEGVLIKNLKNSHPLLQACLRVTIGTESENKSFLVALKQILKVYAVESY